MFRKTQFKNSLLATISLVASLGLVQSPAFAGSLTLHSDSIANGGALGNKNLWNNFGCAGENIMPDLKWSGAPSDTKSFAITVHDEDAPTGSGFWHWIAYNIPANITSLPGGVAGGQLPAGITQGNTDLGNPGYFGACPPVGRLHHYKYTVYALKTEKLPVPNNATAALTGFFLWQNTLEQASITFTAGPRK